MLCSQGWQGGLYGLRHVREASGLDTGAVEQLRRVEPATSANTVWTAGTTEYLFPRNDRRVQQETPLLSPWIALIIWQ